MVATTDCDKPRGLSSNNKVSKPLMEKKRRARINQCLDQLKSLLESHYSSTIRKRKLEKADILELTVRHMKHLQKMQKFSGVESDYQTGFRSCMSNVNHYLLTAEHLSGADRWKLSQLASRLGADRGPEEAGCSGTMDSALGHAHTQDGTGTRRPVPTRAVGPEKSDKVKCETFRPATAHGLLTGDGQPCSDAFTGSPTHNQAKTASPKIHHDAINCQLTVWRPW